MSPVIPRSRPGSSGVFRAGAGAMLLPCAAFPFALDSPSASGAAGSPTPGLARDRGRVRGRFRATCPRAASSVVEPRCGISTFAAARLGLPWSSRRTRRGCKAFLPASPVLVDKGRVRNAAWSSAEPSRKQKKRISLPATGQGSAAGRGCVYGEVRNGETSSLLGEHGCVPSPGRSPGSWARRCDDLAAFPSRAGDSGVRARVPIYSGGTAPDSHRFPCYPVRDPGTGRPRGPPRYGWCLSQPGGPVNHGNSERLPPFVLSVARRSRRTRFLTSPGRCGALWTIWRRPRSTPMPRSRRSGSRLRRSPGRSFGHDGGGRHDRERRYQG